MLQTEYEFTLPCGYVDAQGTLHQHGVMRLATVLDDIESMQDARVRANSAYLSVLLLGRVITVLGSIAPVTPAVVERLFSADYVYLQDLFVRINDAGSGIIETECPSCGTRFPLDLLQGATP
jgi:hypothetical protein